MSAKKADTKKAEVQEAAAAPASDTAAPATTTTKSDEIVANKIIEELNRVHVRIPRY